MLEFHINKYILLKLENSTTNLYLDRELFRQCRYILLINPHEKEDQRYIRTVDDAKKKLNSGLEGKLKLEDLGISPIEEFWAHCSNLQVWCENDYDTSLIHSNLAFPLLKKLMEIGDPLARKVFKKELAKTVEICEETLFVETMGYLMIENYLNMFNKSEKKALSWTLRNILCKLLKKYKLQKLLFLLETKILHYLIKEDIIYLFKNLNLKFFENILYSVIENKNKIYFFSETPIFNDQIVNLIYEILIKKIKIVLKSNNEENIIALIRLRILEQLKKKDLFTLIELYDFRLIKSIFLARYNYFDEFEIWIQNFLKKISKIIKKYIEKITLDNNVDELRQFLTYGCHFELKKKDVLLIKHNRKIDIINFILNFLKKQEKNWIINHYDYQFYKLIRKYKQGNLNLPNTKIKAEILRVIFPT